MSMTLSEDVFNDTMPPCEKLYNAEAALQSRFRELVSSRYYQSFINLYDSRSSRWWPARSLEMTQQIIVSPVIIWQILINTPTKAVPKSSSCLVWSSSCSFCTSSWVFSRGSSLQASPSVRCSGLLFWDVFLCARSTREQHFCAFVWCLLPIPPAFVTFFFNCVLLTLPTILDRWDSSLRFFS